jgi:methylisocitrate lyase
MSRLPQMLREAEPVFAPGVFDPLSAKLAEAAGFKVLYLAGGVLGYVKVVTEATLTLSELIQTGLEIRTVTNLPLILDGVCGFGEPMHLHRTIAMSEAAGFAAIEIEDQLVPKRAHHHVGHEHLIPAAQMVQKVEEAVAARRDPDFLIIARTNAVRTDSMTEALRRAEAYRAAGADMLWVLHKSPDDVRTIGERLGPPLMYQALSGGLDAMGFTPAEMHDLGYRLIVDGMTPLLAVHETLSASYRAMAERAVDPTLGAGSRAAQARALNETIGLGRLLEIERRTVGEMTPDSPTVPRGGAR